MREKTRRRNRELARRALRLTIEAARGAPASTSDRGVDPPSSVVDSGDVGGVDRSVPRASSAPGDEIEHDEHGHAQINTCLLSDRAVDVEARVTEGPRGEPRDAVEAIAVAEDPTSTPPPIPPADDPPHEEPAAPDLHPAPARPSLRLVDASGADADRQWIPRDARATTSMLRDIFLEHPDWIGVVAYDEFRREICKRSPAPWDEEAGDPWTNEDVTEARCWINDKLRANVPRDMIYEAIDLVARRSSYNSLSEEIRALGPLWDGRSRIDDWTRTYLRSPENEYARDVGRRWLLSATARALAPGCKADHVIVLEAPLGGERKSTALEILAGASRSGHSYYCDSNIDLQSTFAPAQLVGVFIYEIPELIMFKSFGSERSKAFLSKRVDDYSRKHEKQKTSQARMNVFGATTNKGRYLDDPNGRRTWPVPVGRVAVDALARDRDQLFAECVSILLPELIVPARKNRRPYFDEFKLPVEKRWWLDRAGESRAREQQELRYAADAWEEPISRWMDESTHLLDPHNGGRGFTFVSEVLEKALKLKPGQWSRKEEMRVAEILTDRFHWRKGPRCRGPRGGLIYPYMLPAEPEPDPADPAGNVQDVTVHVTAEASSAPTDPRDCSNGGNEVGTEVGTPLS